MVNIQHHGAPPMRAARIEPELASRITFPLGTTTAHRIAILVCARELNRAARRLEELEAALAEAIYDRDMARAQVPR